MSTPPSEPPPNGDAPGAAAPTTPTRHVRERSAMARLPDGGTRFQARCSCGWESGPVPMGAVFAVWDQHREAPGQPEHD